MERPALARECRIYIYNLALRLGCESKALTWRRASKSSRSRMSCERENLATPFVDRLGFIAAQTGDFGSTERTTIWKQISYLNGLRKVSEEQIRTFIAGKTMPPEFDRQRSSADQSAPYVHASGREFRILDHVGKVRKVGRTTLRSVRPVPKPVRIEVVTTWRSPLKTRENTCAGQVVAKNDSPSGGLPYPRSAIRVRRWICRTSKILWRVGGSPCQSECFDA